MKLGALSEYKDQPAPQKGMTLFTIALAVVSVVVSFTEIKCGKPAKRFRYHQYGSIVQSCGSA